MAGLCPEFHGEAFPDGGGYGPSIRVAINDASSTHSSFLPVADIHSWHPETGSLDNAARRVPHHHAYMLHSAQIAGLTHGSEGHSPAGIGIDVVVDHPVYDPTIHIGIGLGENNF